MFYAVEALLLSRELSYSIHSGVIAAFAKEFVKTGTFDSRFHRYLLIPSCVQDWAGINPASRLWLFYCIKNC